MVDLSKVVERALRPPDPEPDPILLPHLYSANTMAGEAARLVRKKAMLAAGYGGDSITYGSAVLTSGDVEAEMLRRKEQMRRYAEEERRMVDALHLQQMVHTVSLDEWYELLGTTNGLIRKQVDYPPRPKRTIKQKRGHMDNQHPVRMAKRKGGRG